MRGLRPCPAGAQREDEPAPTRGSAGGTARAGTGGAGRGGAGSGSPAAQGCGTAASGAEAAGAERAAPAPRQRRGSGRPGPGRGGRAGSLRIPQLVRAPPPKGRDEERNCPRVYRVCLHPVAPSQCSSGRACARMESGGLCGWGCAGSPPHVAGSEVFCMSCSFYVSSRVWLVGPFLDKGER